MIWMPETVKSTDNLIHPSKWQLTTGIAYEISILYEWFYIFNLCTLYHILDSKLAPTLYNWIFKLGRAGSSLHWQQGWLYLPIIIKGSASGDYLAIAHPPTRANCPLLNWTRHKVLRATSTLHYACSNRSQGLIFYENSETLLRCLAANNNPSRLHTNRIPD